MSRGDDFILNSYRIVWLFDFFDLPVKTAKNRKDAVRFRANLESDGFRMMQYSVYIRFCGSRENADVPSPGMVSILSVTDKQYSNMVNVWGMAERRLPGTPKQLELF